MMKLLLFSDLHSDTQYADQLVEQAKHADILVGAGDFGNVRRGLNLTIDRLKQSHKPAILVPGNSESTEELIHACRDWPQAHVLHGTGVNVSGVEFFGIGGGIPVTPFGAWSYDFTEEDATKLLANCPSTCEVLVSHSPPKGALDQSSRGQSLGSVAVRAVVDQNKPNLVVCGHIHASAGQSMRVGTTTVINAGPLGILWELNDRQ
ncbi:MAG: metallophosphoesterase [Chloroflexota bacterium]